jgi:hypothetical protein
MLYFALGCGTGGAHASRTLQDAGCRDCANDAFVGGDDAPTDQADDGAAEMETGAPGSDGTASWPEAASVEGGPDAGGQDATMLDGGTDAALADSTSPEAEADGPNAAVDSGLPPLFSECFAQGAYQSCDAYCGSFDASCVPSGCISNSGLETSLSYSTQADCVANTGTVLSISGSCGQAITAIWATQMNRCCCTLAP